MATKAIITDYGRNQIAQALAGDYKIQIGALVYGDGNGSVYDPVASQTDLLHRLGSIDTIGKAEAGAWTYYYSEIPSYVYNITIREIGIVDQYNQLLIVATVPPAELMQPEGGVLQRLPIRFGVTTSIGNVLIVQAPSSIPIFTNESLGIIRGNEEDGYVFREDEDDSTGFGAVYGWDNTFKKISDSEQRVSSTTVYLLDTVSYVENADGETYTFWENQSDRLVIGDPRNHLHFQTDDSNYGGFGDHITATTPQGEKAIAWLDDTSGAGIAGMTPYSFNFGAVTMDGKADFAYLVGRNFGIKSGTKYTDSSRTHTLSEDIFDTLGYDDDEEYNVYIHYDEEHDSYSVIKKLNKEYRQMQRPINANDGDYWLRTLEPLEAYWIRRSASGEYAYIFTNDVFAFRIAHSTAGFRYAVYTGTIIADQNRHALTLPDDYSIVTPSNFHWELLGRGTINDAGMDTYRLFTESRTLQAVMPDYAWNGYNVNMRTLQDVQNRTLPDVMGHVNQILMCDGTKAYWTTISALLEESLANIMYREVEG